MPRCQRRQVTADYLHRQILAGSFDRRTAAAGARLRRSDPHSVQSPALPVENDHGAAHHARFTKLRSGKRPNTPAATATGRNGGS